MDNARGADLRVTGTRSWSMRYLCVRGLIATFSLVVKIALISGFLAKLAEPGADPWAQYVWVRQCLQLVGTVTHE